MPDTRTITLQVTFTFSDPVPADDIPEIIKIDRWIIDNAGMDPAIAIAITRIADDAADEDEEEQTVTLQASRYEWDCPHCRVSNLVAGRAAAVICENCDRTFDVGDVEHAG